MRDFDRPLNQRGLKVAPQVGQVMRKRKLQPDLVLSSPAERARQTARLVLEAGKFNAELRHDERIYEASAARLFEIISQIEDSANVALLVGHNPGLEELLEVLTGEAREMPTASLACIELNIDKWSKLREKSGHLSSFLKAQKPKPA